MKKKWTNEEHFLKLDQILNTKIFKDTPSKEFSRPQYSWFGELCGAAFGCVVCISTYCWKINPK